MRSLLLLILCIILDCRDVDAQACKKEWVEGYVIYYRDSIGHHDEDVEINHSGFEYFFEKEISSNVIDNYLKSNDTFPFVTIGHPWDGMLYIYDGQKNYKDCLKEEGLTYDKYRSYRFFVDNNIPAFLINSNCRFISVFKFRGQAITNFQAQNFINRYAAQTILLLPNKDNKLEYLFSITGPCPKS